MLPTKWFGRVLSLSSLLGIAFARQNFSRSSSLGTTTNGECGLYLAPSTIPNAGMGIFTARPLKKGEVIGNGDISIPVADFAWLRDEDRFNPFAEYVWESSSVGMTQEIEQSKGVSGFCPGLDAAVNCNNALINTDKTAPVFDTGGLHRSRDPGAGAITPYHNGSTAAYVDIPAGGEIFKSYGDGWFQSRTYAMGLLPLSDDFDIADNIMSTLSELELSSEGKSSLWNLVQNFPWVSRTTNALPAKIDDALQAAQEGIRSLHQPSAIQSVEFLRENGRCMDNIRPGPSTIKGAGRGAFATRFLAAGTTVTGSPLIRVPNREFIDMYDSKNEIVGNQILQNYCFGHNESTLLLCPYGSGVGYINHNSSRANVKLQWVPDGFLGQKDDTFDVEVWEMEYDYTVSLAFDFVATRNIVPGEELLLDYGIEWEEAWEAHVREWKAPNGSQDYATAKEWNERLRDQVLRTRLEQELEPYPSNLILRCHTWIETAWVENLTNWENGEMGVDCDILYRYQKDGATVYEVELHNSSVDGELKRVYHVARSSLNFVDKPRTMDHHLRNAFRHSMMVPDDMFPDQWRDLSRYE